jgi:hypothetical protein
LFAGSAIVCESNLEEREMKTSVSVMFRIDGGSGAGYGGYGDYN